MKMSQKNLEYVLLLFIVIIAAGAYYFGYMKYSDKAKTLSTQNKALEAQIVSLSEKERNLEQYVQEIDSAESKVSDIISVYGTGNTPEKSILLMRELEKRAGMEISNISFYDDELVYVSQALREDGSPKLLGYQTQLAITYTTSYDGLKRAMDFINGYPERMNVRNFTAVFNQETGGLTGTMNIGLYSIDDGIYEYISPEVSGISLGTDNIFGTIELQNEE